MKSLITTLLVSAWIIIASFNVNAQNFVPAASDYYELGLLFSQYDYMGTSRIQSLGGAQTGLGADLSSALSNPAGLGLYNRSEVSLSPSVNAFSGTSTYLNNAESFSQPNFNIGHLGVALQKSYDNDIGFISGTFAFTYTKVNNFNQRYNIRGFNNTNDILDQYSQNATDSPFNPDDWSLLTYQAYNAYLIDLFVDTTATPDNYFYDRLISEENPQINAVEQADEVITTGSQSQWSISYGANFNDVFFVGAGLGIQSLQYNIERYYAEYYAPGNILMDMNFLEDLEVRGSGINVNFGVLARPIPSLMIGASVISPTLLVLSEISNTSTESYYDNFEYESSDGPITLNNEYTENESLFDYQITTPARYNVGATFFLGKSGFLTADVEFVDYSKIKFDSQDDPLKDQQLIAQTQYANTVNLKFGGEARLNKYRFRIGYAYKQSPYAFDDGTKKDVSKYTVGLGYRTSKFFADLSTAYQSGLNNYAPYSFDPSSTLQKDYFVTPISQIDYQNMNFTVSVGLFF